MELDIFPDINIDTFLKIPISMGWSGVSCNPFLTPSLRIQLKTDLKSETKTGSRKQ